MKSLFCLSIVIALVTPSSADIVRRTGGVKKILPGNQITVSGNGAGVVTVGVAGGISVSTSTLGTSIATNSAVLADLLSDISTNTTRSLFDAFTSTAQDQITNALNSNATAQTYAEGTRNAISTTTTLILVALNSNATAQTYAEGTRNAISTTTTELQTRSVPIRISDEGTSITNAVTAIDCVGGGVACTASGSTVTLTIAGSSGGGGGINPFSIVIGTFGSVAGSVDIASSNVNGLNDALARCGAMGLLETSTAVCTILYKSGTYIMAGATTPAKVKVWAVPDSSTVWKPSANNTSIVDVYGTLDGIDFDWDGKAYVGRGVVLHSSGSVRNFVSYNAASADAGSSNLMSLFYLYNTVGATLQGDMRDMAARFVQLGTKPAGIVTAENSRDSHIILKTSNISYAATNRGFIVIQASTNTFIEDSEFRSAGGNFVLIEGGNNGCGMVRSKMWVDAGIDGDGLVEVGLVTNSPVVFGSSTRTVISDNTFYTTQTGKIINAEINGSNGGLISGTLIKGNVVVNNSGGAVTFLTTVAGQSGTVAMGNKVDNGVTFVSDGGNGTKTASLGNFVYNVEQ